MNDSPHDARIPASVHAALVAVQLMFASLSIVGKLALAELSPFALICARVTVATAIMLVAWLVAGREKIERRDLPELAAYAFFGVTANMLIFILGLQRTTATNAVVIGATIPVFTVGVAVVLRREVATAGKLVGLGVACVGAMIIVGAGRFQTSGGRLVGNLLIVLNSLSFSIYLVISRRLLAKYRPLTVVTWTFVFGALGVLPFGALPLVHAAPSLSRQAWGYVAYIVVAPTVGTYFLNMYALRRAPASLVAIYIYVQPIVGALMAAARLGERPAADTYVGGAFIGLGIWLVSREARRLRRVQQQARA
ncbi:MAG TPA: DMT family transporter [Polyangia bacterium]|nr:DMT family transporter [Polyangia bacterium]